MRYPNSVLTKITLSALDVSESGVLPSKVRLFTRGVNRTTKGDFLFDDIAAASVMSAASEHAVDCMLDLEHRSLDPDSPNYDTDARAWYRLDVIDGELWMVDLSYTPDGERRLRERTQRYPSPAFETDDSVEPPRITVIHNVALTSLPATFGAFPIVASDRSKGKIMDPKTMARLLAMRAEGKPDADIMTALAIDMKSLQTVVKAMGGDPNAPLGQLFGVVAAYAKELADMAAGKDEAPAGDAAPESADAPAEEAPMLSSAAGELVRLRAAQDATVKEQEKELRQLRAQAAEREAKDRVELTAAIVRAGGLTPAVAWANADTREPSEMIQKLSVSDLHSWLSRVGGQRPQLVEPPRGASVVSASYGPDVSEYEAKRVEHLARKNKVDVETALDNYREVKQRQLNAAMRTSRDVNRFGRELTQDDVIATVTGRIGTEEIRRLSNPVRPHESFGATSQRAIEEFRLDLMVNQAAMPEDWTQKFGLTVTGGTTKETFPLDFSAVKFQERTSQGPAAETPQSRDIQLTKRLFEVAKQGDLRRIQDGDFAYIRTWQQGPAQMARAKVTLRATLLKTALEAGTSTYWGYSADQPTGVEGKYYFSATHLVHPFNPKITIAATGAATWSNYQASATPLNTVNLYTELDSMLYVPHFDGELMGTEGDEIMYPTSLAGVARRMFDMQAFRTDGEASSIQLSNEFFGRPMGRTQASHLTGTDATADYYLFNSQTIAAGFFPWVIAEDSEDEIVIWDESSDFYRNTNYIKIGEKTYINIALAWPQGVRLVKGA